MADEPNKIPRPLNILVVDDERRFRDVVAARLDRAGFRVETAQDGATALAELQKRKFDLVVLDIVMPGMSGFDVLREVRSRDAETKIIMLSILRQEEDLRLARELGASECFAKLSPTFMDEVANYAEQLSFQ